MRVHGAAFFLITCLLIPGWAVAQQTDQATKLHKQALNAADLENWTTALELWEAAESLSPDWRYAFNQASIHAHSGRWAETWHAIERATRYGIPAKRLESARKLMEKAESYLLNDHAFIELKVIPADAAVELNGKTWKAPQQRWVQEARSNVRVSKEGHAPYMGVFDHPIGQKNKLVVTLQKKGAGNRLLIEGSPAGAEITLNGVMVGKLPQYDKRRLKPGKYRVHVEKAGYQSFDKTVTIRDDVTALLQVDLVPNARIVTLQKVGGSGRPVKWVTVGIGLALLGAGVGTHIAALDAASDANANADVEPGEDAIERREKYNGAIDRMSSLRTTTYVLYGLSGAALTTGFIMFLVDADSPVMPTVISGGGMGVSWHGTF
jgi:hypothetical protein